MAGNSSDEPETPVENLGQDYESELARMRFLFSRWTLVSIMATTAILLFSVFGLTMSSPGNRERLLAEIFAHAPASIGIPFCSIIAMFVVLMLRATQGPVEFEAIGLKFRGASGPIVMWVLCFLAMILAMKLLWP